MIRPPYVALIVLPLLLMASDLLPDDGAGLTVARAAFGVPSVLLVPGLLLLHGLKRLRGGVLGVADAATLSAGIVIFTGLLMNLLGIALTRRSWSVALFVLAVACAVPTLRSGSRAQALALSGRPSSVVVVLQVAILLGIAAWVSVVSAQRVEQHDPALTLSVARDARSVPVLALVSKTTAAGDFDVVVTVGAAVPQHFRVRVDSGHPWTLPMPGAAATTMRAAVYPTGVPLPAASLRSVSLAAP